MLSLADPLNDDACYSITKLGGPTNSYLGVGTARNAAVRLFDVRQGGQGSVTIFGQRKERSPVYGVVLEYSRLYAVTEKRGFVFDFDQSSEVAGEDRAVGYYTHVGGGAGEFRKSDGGVW